ncbi:MAG: hypothetical protein WB586_13060, partial [Chthoniobacterales bacterium]
GTEALNLHHLYRAMAFLGQEIEPMGQKTLGTPRCLKDLIEEELFERRWAGTQKPPAQHRDQLESISGELLKRESLDGATFYRLVEVTQPSPEKTEVAHATVG